MAGRDVREEGERERRKITVETGVDTPVFWIM